MQPLTDPHLPALREALAHQKAGRLAPAEAAYRQILKSNPAHAMALHLLGVLLSQSGRAVQGVVCVRSSLALSPRDALAWYNLANMLNSLGRSEEALEASDQALALHPHYAQAHASRGSALHVLGRYADAAKALEAALQLEPGHQAALDTLLLVRLFTCQWNGYQKMVDEVERQVRQGAGATTPFAFLCCSDAADLQLQCAQRHAATAVPARTPLRLVPHADGKIRLAYLSADFHAHATAYLVSELIELHDRHRFEVIAVSFGPDDHSPSRLRLEKAFDRFIQANHLTDQQVAELLVQAQIDIAVDLKGFTKDCRPGIFSYKPAPVLVNYLGYPGTMGAPCFDYIIGDAVVTPATHAAYYSEKIVQLPHSYQVNDRQRAVAVHTPSRLDEGLPDSGFVFACFNANYKITPPVFDIWMGLLQRVEGSVLWLLADNAPAMENLRREAQQRGIAADRLVFARRMPLPQHLARQPLADLFLDTLPVNAHTTASDALWMGLPVLTCMGQGFAARVAASLLHAVGLPELITHDLAAYEALALQLATHPDQMQAIRRKLLAQRDASPLFDSALFTRHLEKAFVQMHARQRQGLAPVAMTID